MSISNLTIQQINKKGHITMYVLFRDDTAICGWAGIGHAKQSINYEIKPPYRLEEVEWALIHRKVIDTTTWQNR